MAIHKHNSSHPQSSDNQGPVSPTDSKPAVAVVVPSQKKIKSNS